MKYYGRSIIACMNISSRRIIIASIVNAMAANSGNKTVDCVSFV